MTQQSDFDLILMDVLMPGIDGCEATERIREITGATRTRPYILGLSADALQENQDRCREAGMDGFLTKPIRIVELVRAVQSAFQAAK